MSGELFVDGRGAPLVVVLSEGDLNGTKQVIGEHRDEEVRGGSPRELVINRSKPEIALEGSEVTPLTEIPQGRLPKFPSPT